MSFIRALKWSFLAELASKAIAPVVFIVLARLLTPEDFGVMSAAMMVIAFSQIFWEAGMGKALIQRQTDIEDATNVAFWTNLGLGILISVLLFWGARPIAQTFFQDERVTAVLQVMTLQILLGALSSVQTALLQKQMGFKELFWVRLMTVALPGVASIPLAWNGMGYWALVAGALVGQAAQLVVLWRMSDWRPAMRFVFAVAKPMAKFGAWVGASGLLAWFYIWADSLVVGAYMSSHDLGLYKTGNQFVAMVYALAFAPITPVLYSRLSQAGVDKKSIEEKLAAMMNLMTISSVPIAFIVFSVRDQFESFIFGSAWAGIGTVIGFMVFVQGYSYVTSMNVECYRAAGFPEYEALATILPVPFYLAVYLIAASQGLDFFLAARLLVVLFVATPINLIIAKYLFKVGISKIAFFIMFVSVVSTVWIFYKKCFSFFFGSSFYVSLLSISIGTLTFFVIMFFFQRKVLTSNFNNIFN